MLLVAVFAAPGADAASRQTLFAGASTYPRVVVLHHSLLANGRAISSVNTWQGNNGVGVISESTDHGQTFHQIATIQDPAAANGQGLCCSALYELPQRVGMLPEGTLLWSDNVGFNTDDPAQRHTSIRLWASFDNGHHWSFLSTVATSPNQYPIWEPSFEVAEDGALVVFYSDESDKDHHDQKLVQERSYDGKTWQDKTDTVVDDDWSVRPGMAKAVPLPNGQYLMSYEMCNQDLKHQCAVHLRRSDDGWNFGDPRAPGTLVRTPDGKYARHTPTLTYSPNPAPNGTLLLGSEMLVNADGSIAPENGRTILGNTHLGDGSWYEMPAPVPVAGPNNGSCKNFGPSVASFDDGTMVEAATDRAGANNTCETFYGTGPVSQG